MHIAMQNGHHVLPVFGSLSKNLYSNTLHCKDDKRKHTASAHYYIEKHAFKFSQLTTIIELKNYSVDSAFG